MKRWVLPGIGRLAHCEILIKSDGGLARKWTLTIQQIWESISSPILGHGAGDCCPRQVRSGRFDPQSLRSVPEPSCAAKQGGREKTLAAAWNQNLNNDVAYLTAITFTTGPSVVLPRNLLLLADSAAPLPPIPLLLLKKSLLEMRTGPPSTFT